MPHFIYDPVFGRVGRAVTFGGGALATITDVNGNPLTVTAPTGAVGTTVIPDPVTGRVEFDTGANGPGVAQVTINGFTQQVTSGAWAAGLPAQLTSIVSGSPSDSAVGAAVTSGSQTRSALQTWYVNEVAPIYRVADYASPQAAIDAAPAGATVQFSPGNTSTLTSPLSISKSLRLAGHTQFGSRAIFNGCHGVSVAAGVSDFHVENLEVAQATRYSTTANAFLGFLIDGATGSRPSNHSYRNVYVDGFRTAWQTRYLWSSVFNNARSNFGLIGLDVYGLSVNNVVTGNSQLTVAGGVGSKGIRLAGQESSTDATVVGSEGWTISDTLVYGAETGIDLIANVNVTIHDCIIDFNTKYGVRLSANGTAYAGNCNIHDNYIAMNGASGVAGVQSANTVSNTANTWNLIHDNEILAYSGATCTYGINQSGGYGLINAHDNTLNGFSSADIFTQSAGNRIVGNRCQSAVTNNISFLDGQLNEIGGNTGVVYNPGVGNPMGYVTVGGRKEARGNAIPTVGTWVAGDRLVNAAPAVGSPKAWVCTVAGTPGTWVSEGNL